MSSVKVSGTWQDIDEIHVKVSGVWEQVAEGYVRVGGVWQEFYNNLSVVVAATKLISNTLGFGTCYAGVRVDSDGDLYEQGPGVATFSSYETWLDSGSNTQVWVLCSVVSGSVSGSATATRLACTSDRTWTINNGGSGTTTAEVDLQFYDAASGGNLLDVQTVNLSASDI